MRFTNALRDLVALIFIVTAVLILSYFFSIFSFLVTVFQKYPRAVTYIDEIITGLLAFSIGLAIFAWRRWMELKKETAERIKKQQEVIELTATQAEVERIIGKELRSDRDQIKESLQEVLRMIASRRKV